MSAGHYFDAGGYISVGAAAPLRPVSALEARVYTHRDAERVLDAVTADEVLVVAPTSLASSYALTQRPLTAIEVTSLRAAVRERLQAGTDTDLNQFEYIQLGRQPTPAQNRSLSEF
jgi:hypothetical protein